MATAMTACAGRKRGRNGEAIQINTLGCSTKPVPALTSAYKPAVFSHDEEAAITRAACDYSMRITHEVAKSGLADRPVRVYADGIYDMFHTGHARQLQQAKAAFPNTYLIVGVCSEELTLEMKGRTVMTEDERYEAICHCRYVDELVTDAPWLLTDEFLEYHKIDFVAHDDLPYSAGDDDDIYKDIKARGMFLATNRTDGISTTDVIARIIKDYDMYVRRNLTRGYTAKDLNVSYMREKKLKIQENLDKVRHHGRELRHKGQELMNRWEYNAKEMISSFLDMFGQDGKIKTWIHKGRLKMARAISPPASPLHESQRQTRQFTNQRLKRNPSGSPPAKRSRRMRYRASSASEDDDGDSSDDSTFDNDVWVENGSVVRA